MHNNKLIPCQKPQFLKVDECNSEVFGCDGINIKKVSSYNCGMLRSVVKPLFAFRSKRIISMRPTRVSLRHELEESEPTQPTAQATSNVSSRGIPDMWETMPFDQLCALSPEVLRKLEL
jgi:hypothetical protein